MSLANDLRAIVRKHSGANVEYARDGYRVSLNPVGDRHSDIGFILWRDDPDGPVPIIAGRAVENRIVVHDPDFDGNPAQVEAVIRLLVEDGTPSVASPPLPESAVPTGG